MEFIDASTIVSLLPVAISETKPGLQPAQYFIPAVKDPASDFNLLVVLRGKFPVYIDESRPAIVVPEPSDRIAQSICRDLKVGWPHLEKEVSEPGLFWVPGKRTKVEINTDKDCKKLLDTAREWQNEWFKRLVEEADNYWQQHKARRMISDVQRKAAILLKLDREWNIDQEVADSMSVCKFCRSMIHPAAIVCPSCQGILDMPRAKEAGFIKATA
jgi:hypothetical protein